MGGAKAFVHQKGARQTQRAEALGHPQRHRCNAKKNSNAQPATKLKGKTSTKRNAAAVAATSATPPGEKSMATRNAGKTPTRQCNERNDSVISTPIPRHPACPVAASISAPNETFDRISALQREESDKDGRRPGGSGPLIGHRCDLQSSKTFIVANIARQQSPAHGLWSKTAKLIVQYTDTPTIVPTPHSRRRH